MYLSVQNNLVESAIKAILVGVESIQKDVDVKIKMVKTLKFLLQINKVEHTKLLTKNTLALEAWQVAIKQIKCVEVSKDYTFLSSGVHEKWQSTPIS
jgi:hypothetical protein